MSLDIVLIIPHLFEEKLNFKVFIKPFILKGGDHLVVKPKLKILASICVTMVY